MSLEKEAGSPIEIKIDGKTYLPKPLGLGNLGRLIRYIKKRPISLTYEVIKELEAEGSKVSFDERSLMLNRAMEESFKIRITDLAGLSQHLLEPDVMLRTLAFSFEKNHPEFKDLEYAENFFEKIEEDSHSILNQVLQIDDEESGKGKDEGSDAGKDEGRDESKNAESQAE